MVEQAQNNNTEERLVFTQTWFDFWFIVIFFCVILLAIIWKEMHSFSVFAIFIYSMVQIFLPVYIIFRIVGIRVFELTPEYIQIKVGNTQHVIKINKDDIDTIQIKYIPGFLLLGRGRSEKIAFYFRYKKDINLNLKGLKKFFYGKKISTNNYLFLDDTPKVILYIEKYYPEKVIIDDAVKRYVKRKNENTSK